MGGGVLVRLGGGGRWWGWLAAAAVVAVVVVVVAEKQNIYIYICIYTQILHKNRHASGQKLKSCSTNLFVLFLKEPSYVRHATQQSKQFQTISSRASQTLKPPIFNTRASQNAPLFQAEDPPPAAASWGDLAGNSQETLGFRGFECHDLSAHDAKHVIVHNGPRSRPPEIGSQTHNSS